MIDEAKVNKFAKRQIRAFPWGFIICGIITIIMGSIFTVVFQLLSNPFISMTAFLPFPPWGLIVIGVGLLITGVVLRYIFTHAGKPKEVFAPTDEESSPVALENAFEHNPSSFLIFPKKSYARLGLRLLIYSIIGLVLSYVLPWVIASRGGILNQTLENHYGDFMGGGASSDIALGASYYQDGVTIVFFVYILILIISIFVMITGIIQANFRTYSRRLSIIATLLGFTVLISGIWMLIGAIRLVSLHILTMPQNNQFNFGDPSFVIFPAAYAALVFGTIYIKNGLRSIRLQYEELELKNTPPASTTIPEEG